MIGLNIPPILAMVEQVPTAVFLMEVGKSWAVYMYFTLAAADTPNLALRVRKAKKGVPGGRKAATIQQIPGRNWVTKNNGFLPQISMIRGRRR